MPQHIALLSLSATLFAFINEVPSFGAGSSFAVEMLLKGLIFGIAVADNPSVDHRKPPQAVVSLNRLSHRGPS